MWKCEGCGASTPDTCTCKRMGELESWSRALHASLERLKDRPALAIAPASYELLSLDLRDASELASMIANHLKAIR